MGNLTCQMGTNRLSPDKVQSKRGFVEHICVPARQGITLLEIIVVMVILIAVASWTIPSVQRSFSAQKLIKAADQIRGELNRARVGAMRSGEIYAFFYQEQTANFKVSAFNGEVMQVLSDSFRRQQDRQTANASFDGESLPRGIRFAGSETVNDARSESAMGENPTGKNLLPILFYPDGSSQTARIFLRSEDSDVAEIRLRGMTGTSTSSFVDRR